MSALDSSTSPRTEGRLTLKKSDVRKGEVVVMVVGCVIVLGWYIARARWPAEMGGPNIGVGVVLILGYVLMLGALGVVVGTIVAERRSRRRL